MTMMMMIMMMTMMMMMMMMMTMMLAVLAVVSRAKQVPIYFASIRRKISCRLQNSRFARKILWISQNWVGRPTWRKISE